MPFNFSFSSSFSAVTVSNNGQAPKGWAYKRESYSNNSGSGVRTTKQKLGEAPVTETRVYDAQGRPLITDGRPRRPRNPGQGRIISIEEITDEHQHGEERR